MKLAPIEDMVDEIFETVIVAETIQSKIEREVVERERATDGTILNQLTTLVESNKDILRKIIKNEPHLIPDSSRND